jgi:hypothetical protein
MSDEYQVRRGKKAEERRRGQTIGGQCVAQSTGSQVLYCPVCYAPVVDSREGKEAHRERMPECRRKC